jgi:hypothetical protein
MKKIFPLLLMSFTTSAISAQEVSLNDSVIFINEKPVALYEKQPANAAEHYNMAVYSFGDDVLIKAEVIKFNAPVAELKPFYYYELSFPQTADSFAIYIEEQNFPLVLGKIIRDYNLISKNELNRNNVSRFIKEYYGGPALLAKIKSFEDHLDETRYFNEQVKRDRTKPVSIVNDRIIMQDGVKIGLIAQVQNSKVSKQIYQPAFAVYDSSRTGVTERILYNEVITTSDETQILLNSSRRIDDTRYYSDWSRDDRTNKSIQARIASERNLYQVSKAANKRMNSSNDAILMRVCYLIENYLL